MSLNSLSKFISALFVALFITACGAGGGGGTTNNGGSSTTPATTSPTITSFTPTTGAVGSIVTITGTNLGNFTPAPVVKFGTIVATVSSATATSITVTVPHTLGAGNSAITLSNLDGTAVVAVGAFNVTVAATVPPAPTGVTATVMSSSQINLSWPAVSGASAYYVYRATTAGLPVASMTNVTSGSALVGPSTVATSLNDTYTLAAATTYYYKVVALNAVGASVASAEVSATTSAVVQPTPIVTGLSTNTGPVGTVVTITGTNLVSGFSPAPTVKFNTTNAGIPYTNVSNTGVTFTVPAGLAVGTYNVTIGGMSGTPLTAGTFTVVAATGTGITLSPALAGISAIPNAVPTLSAPIGGGTTYSYPGTLMFTYRLNAGVEEFNLLIAGTTWHGLNNGGFNAAPGSCAVAANNMGAPLCSSFGITFNRVAGVVTFVNTPMGSNQFGNAPTAATINGSLTFTPF